MVEPMTINEAARRVREEKNAERTREISDGLAASEEFKALMGAYFVDGLAASDPARPVHERLSRVLYLYGVTCIEIGMLYERERHKL